MNYSLPASNLTLEMIAGRMMDIRVKTTLILDITEQVAVLAVPYPVFWVLPLKV
jgi:hypothetical protein